MRHYTSGLRTKGRSTRSGLVGMLEALESRLLFTYDIIDLGTVDGGNHTFNPSINASGMVAGSGTDSQQHGRAFLYSGNGAALQDLGLPQNGASPYFSESAAGINAAGHVALNSFLTNNLTHATLYAAGQFTDLGTLNGSWDESFAAGINDSDTVVGYLYNSSTQARHAFYATAGGAIVDMGTTTGFDRSQASAINAAGQITGWETNSTTGATRAFIYANGTMTAIALPAGFTSSVARAIDSLGTIAGELTGNGPQGYFYADGGYAAIDGLGANGTVNAITDAGAAVGQMTVGGADHAFKTAFIGLEDLNTELPANSGWVLTTATGINAAGMIVGNGTINGQEHAFLLKPAVVVAPTGPLAGGLSLNTLPANVVSGATLKKPAAFTVNVGNSTGTAYSGSVTVNILAINGATSQTIATTTKTLKVSTKVVPVKLSLKALPAGMANGTYSLTVELVDKNGNVNDSPTGQSVTVAAAFVSLSAAVSGVSPGTIAVGKTGAFTVILTDSGNTDATGTATITTGYAVSSLATPTLGTPQSKTVKATTTKPAKLKLKLPTLTIAGTFVPYVSITLNGVTTTAYGATAFTVA